MRSQPIGQRAAEQRQHDGTQALQRQQKACSDDCRCHWHEFGEQHRNGRPQHAVSAKRDHEEQGVQRRQRPAPGCFCIACGGTQRRQEKCERDRDQADQSVHHEHPVRADGDTERADRNQRSKGADTANRPRNADPRARAPSVPIGIGGHGQVDDAPCRAPQHPRDKEQHETAQDAVGECRDGARGTRCRGQYIRAVSARERSNPSVAENANDAIDRQQHADHQRIAAERLRIQRQHDVDDGIAEPDNAEACRGDNRASIALRLSRLFCHRTRNDVYFLSAASPPTTAEPVPLQPSAP